MLFILVYIIESCLVFSVAISNFGLLARQRVMVMPMFVILLAMPALAAKRPPDLGRARA